MSDLAELLERVKAATGVDMLLSNDIWRAVRNQEPGSILYDETPDLTDSIDAALALVERELPGWSWKIVGEPGAVYPHCAVVRNAGKLSDVAEAFVASHRTPPLAILYALLSALIAQEPQT